MLRLSQTIQIISTGEGKVIKCKELRVIHNKLRLNSLTVNLSRTEFFTSGNYIISSLRNTKIFFAKFSSFGSQGNSLTWNPELSVMLTIHRSKVTRVSLCTSLSINHFVNPLWLFSHIFGHCLHMHGRHVFLLCHCFLLQCADGFVVHKLAEGSSTLWSF